MSEQHLRDLVERTAAGAEMPPTPLADDVRRGEAALARRRRGTAALAVAASVAVVAGVVSVTTLGGDDSTEAPAASDPATPSATSATSATSAESPAPPTPTPSPGTAASLEAAVAAVLDPEGVHVVDAGGVSTPVERGGQVGLVTTQIGWQSDDGTSPLVLTARVAASAADAEWGCEACTIERSDLDGQALFTTAPGEVDDLGNVAALLVRDDGTAVALDVPAALVTSGEVGRADVRRVLTSPAIAMPDGTVTGPPPVADPSRIAQDALPGLVVEAESDLRSTGSGRLDGVEVLWQADPARWGEACFWGRCEVREVGGVRLELSRPPGDGGPFAGRVAVEHQGAVRRTRAIVPEDAVDLADLVPLLTDPRWQE